MLSPFTPGFQYEGTAMVAMAYMALFLALHFEYL
jgi:hypothetical protein